MTPALAGGPVPVPFDHSSIANRRQPGRNLHLSIAAPNPARVWNPDPMPARNAAWPPARPYAGVGGSLRAARIGRLVPGRGAGPSAVCRRAGRDVMCGGIVRILIVVVDGRTRPAPSRVLGVTQRGLTMGSAMRALVVRGG